MRSLRKNVILYWSSGSGKEASRASSVPRRLIQSPDRMPRSTPSMSCSSKSSFRQPRLRRREWRTPGGKNLGGDDRPETLPGVTPTISRHIIQGRSYRTHGGSTGSARGGWSRSAPT